MGAVRNRRAVGSLPLHKFLKENALDIDCQHHGDDRVRTRRTRRIARLLEAAWRGGVLSRPRLEGLRHPQGVTDGPWRAALGRLLDSLESEAALNAIGLTFAYVQIAGLIAQRRRAEALWRAHPEIAAVSIAQPIVILGHMRSGTTRLQRMLGCDSRLNHTHFFEMTTPIAPRPDWRVARSWAQLRLLGFLNPEIDRVHPSSPRAVEEVFGLLAFSFYGAQFEAQWRVPGFARWWEEQDRGWVYAEMKRLLQTIAWQRRAPDTPWVLKAPQFMEDLEPLLAAFPDARLVCLSREADAVVASTASLVHHQMQVQADDVDRHWIGQEWLRKTARRQALARKARASRPDVPQIKVDFADVNEDWRAEMRRIYGFVGMEFTPQVDEAIAAYLHDAEATGFRGHRYEASDFGLDRQAIGAALAAT